jgi:hypothetical protein
MFLFKNVSYFLNILSHWLLGKSFTGSTYSFELMLLILGMTFWILLIFFGFCSVVLDDQLLRLKLVLLLVLAGGLPGHDLAWGSLSSRRFIVEWFMNLKNFEFFVCLQIYSLFEWKSTIVPPCMRVLIRRCLLLQFA